MRNAFAHVAASFLVTCLAACGGDGKNVQAGPPAHTLTAAALDSLPRVAFTDGAAVCTADGRNDCPLHAAFANWAGADRFLLWEPGRTVRLWKAGDTSGVAIGVFGDGLGRYANISAAGPIGSGFGLVEAQSRTLMRYGADGTYEKETPLPGVYGLVAWGFVGDLPIFQRLASADSGSVANLEVRILREAGDSAGKSVLTVPVPWLRLNDDALTTPAPLFAPTPVYAVTADRGIVWSRGDLLGAIRLGPSGDTLWTLSSTIAGPDVSAADLDGRRKDLAGAQVPQIDIDSMIARTAKHHPGVTGILLSRDGRIVLSGAPTTQRDSIDYVVLSKDGVPTGRFTFSSRVRPLLMSGDSLLVHRPTEGEPWEVRWLRMAAAH